MWKYEWYKKHRDSTWLAQILETRNEDTKEYYGKLARSDWIIQQLFGYYTCLRYGEKLRQRSKVSVRNYSVCVLDTFIYYYASFHSSLSVSGLIKPGCASERHYGGEITASPHDWYTLLYIRTMPKNITTWPVSVSMSMSTWTFIHWQEQG